MIRKLTALAICTAVLSIICGCSSPAEPSDHSEGGTALSGKELQAPRQENDAYADFDKEPYVVRTTLREYTAYDPATGKGAYGRYTEITVEGKAPETFRSAVEQCNLRAEETLKERVDESVRTRAAQAKKPVFGGSGTAEDEYVTIGYIVNVTRADHVAFSFLETEFQQGPGKTTSDITYRFAGSTYDTQTGEEISLSDLSWDEETCEEKLREAVSSKYGLSGLPPTDPSSYAWTADAVGIRFYFHLDTVPWEKRWEIGDHTDRPFTVAFSYADLPGEKAQTLSEVPDSYIAMIERGKMYDLPHGDMFIYLTGTDDGSAMISITKESGETENLIIEHGDRLSDFYIMRAEGGFYLFRERAGYQEGFFYDFARPDGGFGRFRYETCQFFDSFLGDLDFAVPYNPYCVHMAEVRRSFGEGSYGEGAFVPHGHYSFPSGADDRYKIFVLQDSSLQIDTGGMACRLLEDFPAMQIDEEGKELGEVTVAAGKYLYFESVTGQASRYNIQPERSQWGTYMYVCRVSDGTRVRFESDVESAVATGKGFLNRFSEPVALAKALTEDTVPSVETFYVMIGGKDYPLIPDYSKPNHTGEEIDFDEDLWWQAEGYVGSYEMTDEDREKMKDAWFTPGEISDPESSASMSISEEGEVVLDLFGEIFRGSLPKKRYYHTYVTVGMESDIEGREFQIRLRDGNWHDAPTTIEIFSEGEPATNEPPTVEPITVYLTRVQK